MSSYKFDYFPLIAIIFIYHYVLWFLTEMIFCRCSVIEDIMVLQLTFGHVGSSYMF